MDRAEAHAFMQQKAALQAMQEEMDNARAERFQAELEASKREKFLRDQAKQHDRQEAELSKREEALRVRTCLLDAREKDICDQERALVEGGGAEEATKRAMHRAEQKAANMEVEAEYLKAKLAEETRRAVQAEDKIASHNLETQQLHDALAEA